MNNEVAEKLILKDYFEIDGKRRVNTMKVSPRDDGTIIVWVLNGDNKYGRFTLTKDTAKQLISFLQEHGS